VTDARVDAGYSSPSRLYETARKKLGMTPRPLQAGAPDEELRFTTFQSELGQDAAGCQQCRALWRAVF